MQGLNKCISFFFASKKLKTSIFLSKYILALKPKNEIIFLGNYQFLLPSD